MAKKRLIFFALFLLFSLSCRDKVYKNRFVISGTYLEVISPSKQAAGIVHEEFKRLDRIFNSYNSSSEISRLNNSYNEPVEVSPELIEALQLSKEAFSLTDGAFDVTQGVLYSFWKDLIRQSSIKEFPSEKRVGGLKEISGIKNVSIDQKANTVSIRKKGLKLDLGGIAKGYMVDKAVSKLKQKGINSALVNAGGDIYCLGKNKGNSWQIGLRDPEALSGVIESQGLINEAIATSGDYEQYFEYKGRRFSHLIDPRTGFPVKNDIVSVTVIGKNCTTADSLASAFFVMGLDGINRFLSRNPSTMKIFVVTSTGGKKNIHILK